MHIRKLSVLTLLVVAQLMQGYIDFDACRNCPKPCPKVTIEELEGLSFGGSQAYERKKELLRAVGGNTRALSTQDLEEVLKIAKEQGDFEAHAEAYHRLRVEMGTEDGGKTIVIRLKELGLPILVTTVIAGALGAVCAHYFGPKK